MTREQLIEYPIAMARIASWGLEWLGKPHGDGEVLTVECENGALLKRVVLNSDCVSAALPSSIAEELDTGLLAKLRMDAPPISTRAGIVHKTSRSLTPLASNLVDEVLRAAGDGE